MIKLFEQTLHFQSQHELYEHSSRLQKQKVDTPMRILGKYVGNLVLGRVDVKNDTIPSETVIHKYYVLY